MAVKKGRVCSQDFSRRACDRAAVYHIIDTTGTHRDLCSHHFGLLMSHQLPKGSWVQVQHVGERFDD